MIKNILIVDDSKTICNTLDSMIKKTTNFNTIIVNSKQECKDFLNTTKLKISVALLDLGLPDAPNGEVVDLVNKYKIPSIVLTGSIEKESIFRDKQIVDYVIKDGYFSYKYAISLINRIINNENIKILIASSDLSLATNVKKLLKNYELDSFFASTSEKILDNLSEHKDIKLIFFDEDIKGTNSLELIKTIRQTYTQDTLDITCFADFSNRKNSAKLLKYGINNILYKGFSSEEFYARLTADLNANEFYEDIKNKANKDFLTGAYNRRYFFNEGLLKFKQKDNVKLCMIDIDKFKNINDTYGHDVGDVAIQEVIRILNKKLQDTDCIISRFGGEEFCIAIYDKSDENFISILEDIRKEFENNSLYVKNQKISYTVSIGYTLEKLASLDDMVNKADDGLYKAKNSGRNQVRNAS